jgi:hypothetical protein
LLTAYIAPSASIAVGAFDSAMQLVSWLHCVKVLDVRLQRYRVASSLLARIDFVAGSTARVLFGAYLFGGVTMLQFHLQGMGVQVASQFLVMLPYVATIVVLVLISSNAAWIKANMPASLGKAFTPGG